MTGLERCIGDPRRAALDAKILAWIREEPWEENEAHFGALALELFTFQFAHCEPYRRFCDRRGVHPESIEGWRQIPAIPNAAFKQFSLRSFPANTEIHRFETSGTTTGRPGTLHLDTLKLYEAALLPNFRRHLLPDLDALGGRIQMHILAPSPEEAPTSSLSHMFGVALNRFGGTHSSFDLHDGAIQFTSLFRALEESSEAGHPIALCGTAFAFVHLTDKLAEGGRQFKLPVGSRVMETGGYKGRSRTLPRAKLLSTLEAALGVPQARILNQYGMTELASQFYDSNLHCPGKERRKCCPPWTRVRVLNPDTMKDAAPGEPGLIAIYDLANTGSVFALQTADLGRAVGDGFEIFGRVQGVEMRGCSIGAEAMLAGDLE